MIILPTTTHTDAHKHAHTHTHTHTHRTYNPHLNDLGTERLVGSVLLSIVCDSKPVLELPKRIRLIMRLVCAAMRRRCVTSALAPWDMSAHMHTNVDTLSHATCRELVIKDAHAHGCSTPAQVPNIVRDDRPTDRRTSRLIVELGWVRWLLTALNEECVTPLLSA
jgi:hypothetical protein